MNPLYLPTILVALLFVCATSTGISCYGLEDENDQETCSDLKEDLNEDYIQASDNAASAEEETEVEKIYVEEFKALEREVENETNAALEE